MDIQPVGISVNQPYPFKLPTGEGALTDFLRPNNCLLITLPDITDSEAILLRNGTLRGGILNQNGAILFIWEFSDNQNQHMLFDCPFQAKNIPDIHLPNIHNTHDRLLIDVHIVDSTTKIVKGLRSITMAPQLTLQFLSAVQDQLCTAQTGAQQFQEWMQRTPNQLAQQAVMHTLGL